MSATQLSDFYATNPSESWAVVNIVDQQTSGPVIQLDDRVAIYPCGSFACINIHEPGKAETPTLFFDKGSFVSGELVHYEVEGTNFTATLEGDPEILVFEVFSNGGGTRAPAEGEADDEPE